MKSKLNVHPEWRERKIEATIERGSGFPSVMVEEEMTNPSDINKNIGRCENQRIGRRKCIYFHNGGRPKQRSTCNGGALTKITSDSGMLQMHSKAAIKLDQTVDYFNHQRRNKKTIGSSIQAFRINSRTKN